MVLILRSDIASCVVFVHLSAMHHLFAGVVVTRNVTADLTSYTIDGLQADSAYRVSVSSLIGSREGSPVSMDVRTGTALSY